MTLPDAVAALIRQAVTVGTEAQAFPLLTVDVDGYPHVILLSGRELAVGADGTLLAVVAGRTTQANLRRSGRATLVAVDGTTAHSVKLTVRRTVDAEGLLGAELDATEHKADSVDVALSPISYVATDELARLERWDRSARVLTLLG